MAVPNTNTFALSDVINEINASMSPKSLGECFTEAIGWLFDSNYYGDKDRLSNFRNYGELGIHIVSEGILTVSGEDIIYRGDTSDFKPGASVNAFTARAINNSTDDNIFASEIGIYERQTDTLIQSLGSTNINLQKSGFEDEEKDVLFEWESTWHTYRVLATLHDPGEFRLKWFLNGYVSSVYPDYWGPIYRNLTIKRYVDLDIYSVTKDQGAQTTTFHQYNGETVEHVEDGGITVTGFVQNSGGAVDLSIQDNGNTEEVLTCTIRTTATTLREQKVFTVYHRGRPGNYLSCSDVFPNVTTENTSNTHTWYIDNNSTQMLYSGTFYWQVKQGDTESTSHSVDNGNDTISDLASGGQTSFAHTWDCGDINNTGAYAYFYAKFDTADDWQLIETQLISTQ